MDPESSVDLKGHDPDSFAGQVIEMFGRDAYVKLQQVIGGMEVKLPKNVGRLPEDHYLINALGRPEAERFAQIFGGEQVHFPSGRSGRQTFNKYLTAFAPSRTTRELAEELGVSMRHVRRMRAKAGFVAGRKQPSRPAVSLPAPRQLSRPKIKAAGMWSGYDF